MPSYVHELPSVLRPFVSGCVGYDYVTDPASVHHGVPSTSLTVVIAFEEPLDCSWLDGRPGGRYPVLVAGLHTSPALIRTHGLQRGIQLAVTPLGSRALLGTPAAALANELVPGPELGLSDTVHDQLESADWRTRFALLQTLLEDRLSRHRWSMDPAFEVAWQQITARRGAVRVGRLATEMGISRRHLQTRFRRELGVSPKQAVRLARFEHAQSLLDTGMSIADVAAEAGFADQPHLHREFRALAGMTPRESLSEFPIVHDELPPPARGSEP